MENKFRQKKTLSFIIYAAAAVCAAALFIFSGQRIAERQTEEGRDKLEDALRLASVSCFALEGFYPPNLEYITENYGVIIDTERYTVDYSVFADNIMPEITVLCYSEEMDFSLDEYSADPTEEE